MIKTGLVLIFMLSVLCSTDAVAGPGCAACFGAICGPAVLAECSALAAAAFAAGGIFAPFTWAGCAGVYCVPCIVACACYDASTAVIATNGTMVPMITLTPGDEVQTVDKNYQRVLTKVVAVELQVGNFSGVEIRTAGARIITTNEHRVRILQPQNGLLAMQAVAASTVSKGDIVMENGDFAPVLSVANTFITTKVNLVTQDCTVLSNGVLTETC